MRNWLIFALLVLGIGVAYGQSNEIQETDVHIIFKPDLLEFSFPIPNRDVFEWYQDKTPDNDLEYAWEIRLGGTETRSNYEFGVYLYKYPGSKPTKGDFKKLISESQVSVWNRNGSLNTDLKIKAHIKYDRLIVRVTDKDTISALTVNKPKFVYFTVRTPYNFTTQRQLVNEK